MPPRIPVRTLCKTSQHRTYASVAAVKSMVPDAPAPITRHSPVNPPSHRDPAYRKSQLLRTYVSLLQTTPLIIFFQHNNLKAVEWASIRRELATALGKVPGAEGVADNVKLSVIKTNIFEPALRVAEYAQPMLRDGNGEIAHSVEDEKLDPALTHALSRLSHRAAAKHVDEHPLTPLLTGPLAALTFPSVSPVHLSAALSILNPGQGFAAPTRRAMPGWHQPAVQEGLKKLVLLGARVDGEVFDGEGVRWIGGIEGGLDGLRARLVQMLESAGVGVASTLEAASKSLWFTVEGRRRMLEEPTQESTQS